MSCLLRSLPARLTCLTLVLLVAACSGRTEPYRTAAIPKDAGYASSTPAGHTDYTNASLAHVFRELTHGLEWGARRPGLVRFEDPVRIAMSGPGADQYVSFLGRFLGQIRTLSAIDIAPGSEKANIFVRFVPGAEFFDWTPNQCVIVYGKPDWENLKRNADAYGARAFEESRTQTALTIIIPDTSPPHEIRECLMEEITQALGPSNDLYGLPQSIFNDDNAHTWPTQLDYLMLRVLYDPRLKSGLSAAETEARAQDVLDEIHPQRSGAPALTPPRQADFALWRERLQLMPTLGEGLDRDTLDTTGALLAEARSKAPGSPYHCEAAVLDGVARHHVGKSAALKSLRAAEALCRDVHGADDVRLAQIGLYIAVEHLERKEYDRVLTLIGPIREKVLAHGQEGLVASSHVIEWAARLGKRDKPSADKARAKAIAWSAFAFGNDSEAVEHWRLY